MLQTQRKLSLSYGVLLFCLFLTQDEEEIKKSNISTTKQFSICKRMDIIITTDIYDMKMKVGE